MGTQGGRQAPVSPGCVEVLMDIIVEKYTIGLPVLGEKSWKNAIVFVVVSSYNSQCDCCRKSFRGPTGTHGLTARIMRRTT